MKTKRTTEHATGDAVNHPDHYNAHPSGVECIRVVEHMSFNVGNAVKYAWRADHKGTSPVEDLKKAAWYIAREIERLTSPSTIPGGPHALATQVVESFVRRYGRLPPQVRVGETRVSPVRRRKAKKHS